MADRVFIIHGWDGYPEEGWFPWLRRELERLGFEVQVPQMPNADQPRMETWIPAIARAVGQADGRTFFVGHSMGCKAILGYLDRLPAGVVAGGAVFVAGFLQRLTNLEDDPITRETARRCLAFPVNLANVKTHVRRSVAIFSDNDQFVPLDSQADFRDHLGSEVLIEHNRGHFSGSQGVRELSAALESIVALRRAEGA